jgi:hypothetical protein
MRKPSRFSLAAKRSPSSREAPSFCSPGRPVPSAGALGLLLSFRPALRENQIPHPPPQTPTIFWATTLPLSFRGVLPWSAVRAYRAGRRGICCFLGPCEKQIPHPPQTPWLISLRGGFGMTTPSPLPVLSAGGTATLGCAPRIASCAQAMAVYPRSTTRSCGGGAALGTSNLCGVQQAEVSRETSRRIAGIVRSRPSASRRIAAAASSSGIRSR